MNEPTMETLARRVLVRKGLLTNEEVLEEIKVVKRELEGKRGRQDYAQNAACGWEKMGAGLKDGDDDGICKV